MNSHRIITLPIIAGIIFGFSKIVFGFGNEATHPAITVKCINSSTVDSFLKNNLGLSGGVQTELQYDEEQYNLFIKGRMAQTNFQSDITKRTAFDWMRAGSALEDEDGHYVSIRPRHHFHDPLRNSGLDDKTDHTNYRDLFAWVSRHYSYEFDVTGQSAINWAISGEAQQEPFDNLECWERARYDFHRALTEPQKSRREEFLAMLFLEFGSVLHMIEDMGVPAHARNDFLFGHYQPPLNIGNDFENWVEGVVMADGNQCPWSGSSPVVFDKLSKYFDANSYLGDYLGDGGLPPNTWGLSECSNYQFLSLYTMFGCSGEKYQFPHPAIEHTPANILEFVPQGFKVYFDGSNYGVPHIARQSYTYHITSIWGYKYLELDSTNTTDDVGVFEDYANITVPRTINYTTGLLNYFFRGKLSIEQADCNNGKIVITITNKSKNSDVNQILKGGAFSLYWDDSAGNRTQVTDFTVFRPGTEPQPGNEWNSETLLNYDEPTKAVLTPPESEDMNQYILVYEGIIDSDPNMPDLDDTIQIATDTFYFESASCDQDCNSPPQCLCAKWTDSSGAIPSYVKLIRDPNRCCWLGTFVCGDKEGQNVIFTYNECSGWHAWYGVSSCNYFNEPIDGYTWSKSLSCTGGIIQLTNNASGDWEKIEFAQTDNCNGNCGCEEPGDDCSYCTPSTPRYIKVVIEGTSNCSCGNDICCELLGFSLDGEYILELNAEYLYCYNTGRPYWEDRCTGFNTSCDWSYWTTNSGATLADYCCMGDPYIIYIPYDHLSLWVTKNYDGTFGVRAQLSYGPAYPCCSLWSDIFKSTGNYPESGTCVNGVAGNEFNTYGLIVGGTATVSEF